MLLTGIVCVSAVLYYSWQNRQTWFGYDIYRIESVSMLPTLKPNDIVVVKLIAAKAVVIAVGDIVVLNDPQVQDQQLIKRVAQIPGQDANYVQTRVTLNDITRTPMVTREQVSLKNLNGYFVLGDNPNHSTDSRDFGPVSLEALVGSVVYVYSY